MTEYWLKARVKLKERFNEKYYIDENCIGDSYIIADDVHKAFKQYREINNSIVRFSKRYTPIYRDTDEGTRQVGYCINGITDIDGKKINVEVWIEIFKRADF